MLTYLDDVRVFVQVVDSGNLARAAHVLGRPPNTVSRVLARLEGELGVTLLHRTTRRVALSDRGAVFYRHALALLEAAEAAEASVRTTEGALTGTVRLAVRTTTVQFDVVRALVGLLVEHVGLAVQLVVTDEEVDVVGAGLDLALRVGALPDSSLSARTLGEVVFVIAATPAYLERHGRPRDPADLALHECVRALSARPQTFWSLVGRGGRRVDARVGGRFECSDVRAQSEAIYAGLGLGLRPLGEVRRAAEEGKLERVLPRWTLEPIPVRAVLPPRRGGSTSRPEVEAVITILTEVIGRMS